MTNFIKNLYEKKSLKKKIKSKSEMENEQSGLILSFVSVCILKKDSMKSIMNRFRQ